MKSGGWLMVELRGEPSSPSLNFDLYGLGEGTGQGGWSYESGSVY